MNEFHPKPFAITLIIGLVVAVGVLTWAVTSPAPTADELYGCTVAQQAPTGECK